jgi:hypothetical protein
MRRYIHACIHIYIYDLRNIYIYIHIICIYIYISIHIYIVSVKQVKDLEQSIKRIHQCNEIGSSKLTDLSKRYGINQCGGDFECL